MAKKNKKRAPVSVSDFGTPERKARAEGVQYENIDRRLGSPKRMRVTTQTPLDRYFQREQINRRQYEAGMEFYALWRRAGRSQKVTSDYDAVIVDGGGRSDGNADAFSDYIKILRTIGRDLAQVAQWVCIQGMSANEWAENNGHDPRGGVTVLRLTLDALGDEFGMPRS